MRIIAGIALSLFALAGCSSMNDDAPAPSEVRQTEVQAESQAEQPSVEDAAAHLKAAAFSLDICWKAQVACSAEMDDAHSASQDLASAVEGNANAGSLLGYLGDGDAAYDDYQSQGCASMPGDAECVTVIGSASASYSMAMLFTTGL